MTALTPIEVFQEAAERGLKLGIEPPHTLTVQPANRCPRDFADTLIQHKWHLLAILQLPFTMAYSQTLGETIFLCEDEATKAALVEAGAESFSIYTRADLQILVEHNRAKPFVPDELLRLHQAKRIFNARVNGNV
ncbi:MAG TPA: hypothetical protein VLQ29_15480 [Candidatus Dormibacteraeota bacterium]|nr:hypothetical protein [Candidatus Dormibacteraeota bacterium]